MRRWWRRRRLLPLLAGLAMTAPAVAVGLGPLTLEGVIDGPREGFRLDLYNPYPEETAFVLYPVAIDGEEAQPRVHVLPAAVDLGPRRGRRVLIVADDLRIGETFRFRVCAQRRDPFPGLSINARVCSKITAHRIA